MMVIVMKRHFSMYMDDLLNCVVEMSLVGQFSHKKD